MARSSSKTARPRPNLLAIARSSSSGSVQPHAARPCIAGRVVQHGRKLSRGTLAGLPLFHRGGTLAGLSSAATEAGAAASGSECICSSRAGDEGAVAGDEVGANGRPIARCDAPPLRTTVRGPSTGSTRRPAVKLLNCLVTKPKPKNETDKPDPRTPVTSGLKEAVMIASALGHDGHRLVPRARSRHAGLMRRSGRVR
jgi:hypothetical protein